MNIKTTIKRVAKRIFLVLVYPLYLAYLILSKIGTVDGTFQSFSQALSLFPGKFGIYLRAAFYRLSCVDTSDEISIGFLTIFSHRDTTIEKGVYIGPQCNIGKCRIGKNTLIGSGVHILSGNKQHTFTDSNKSIQEQGGYFEKIEIGEDCWLGNTAVILTSVAPSSIVAAGSVVIKIYNNGDILGGNPAAKLRNRFELGKASA